MNIKIKKKNFQVTLFISMVLYRQRMLWMGGYTSDRVLSLGFGFSRSHNICSYSSFI